MVLSVVVPVKQYYHVKQLAKENKSTMSDIVRDILSDTLTEKTPLNEEYSSIVQNHITNSLASKKNPRKKFNNADM